MFNIILFQPEIPPNTGNIIRLSANTGARLHLIEPLGFELDDKRLKRAGLDYHELTLMKVHQNWEAALAFIKPNRLFALSTKGTSHYTDVTYAPNDAFVFGSETAGLPTDILSQFEKENILRIPQMPQARSLNLSNAVAVLVYEAWRQLDFKI